MSRHRFASVAALAIVMAVLTVPAAGAADPDPSPAVVYQSGDDAVVATASGEELTRIPVLFHPTLDGNVVAGEGVGGGVGIAQTSAFIVVAHDATTGDPLWTVYDARFPIVLDGGNQVAFLPDPLGVRDPQVNSLWIADADGNERLVVQFANGPGLPGYDPGFEGDNGFLAVSFDEDASTAVVTQGNEVDLFIYDLFVVDVATGEVTRLTDDRKSRSPAMSPGGDRVVFGRDVETCGEDFIRASDLVIIDSDGSDERLLFAGSCASWIHNARWVSSHEVVAFSWRTALNGRQLKSLVLVDVDSGRVTPLRSTKNAWWVTVDRATETIAIMKLAEPFVSRPGFIMADVRSGAIVRASDSGALPSMSGDHQWP